MQLFEDPTRVSAAQFTFVEKRDEKRTRVAAEKAALNAARIKAQAAVWKPSGNDSATGDAYKTLFVARLSHDTTEDTLKAVFSDFGSVVSVKLVRDSLTGKSRGYAFVEFESETDLKRAFVDADAKKIDGRRVLVDVERGRTVSTWLPRRLGGGAGFKRKGAPRDNQNWEGREPPQAFAAPPGGYRGPPPMQFGGAPPFGGGGGGGGSGPRGRPLPHIYTGPPPQGAPATRDERVRHGDDYNDDDRSKRPRL
jgi:U1 small nuclear ribonucleoprotein